MSPEQQQLEAAIAALEAQRAVLGPAVVEPLLAAAFDRLAALTALPESPVESEQKLKQVCILFLDVVGSTTLSERLDPEAVSAVMDDALMRGTAVVEAHRGKVLQYAGDNILAAFGADEAREDDAERAVHCGLALLGLGKALGLEVLAAHGHAGFDVRVGIHTGGVLLGGGVDAEGSIRGRAVNIAARMEQTAPAGGLRISHDTYAQVRGLFEVEAQEPLAIKGVDAPVKSWLVKHAKPRRFRMGTRGIEGVVTCMVGRQTELAALQAAFRSLFAERTLATVTVVADAGIGKSRLLYEFGAWSEAQPETFLLFRGRATPATGSQTFGLLRDLIAWRFQIQDDDSLDSARQKMLDGMLPLFVHDDGPELAEGHAHLLGHLIGIDWKDSRHVRGILDDPKQIRSRAFHAAAQLFRRLSAHEDSPIVLQLEDLHWADGESLEFLKYLAEVNQDVPLLALAFTRPPLFERTPDWVDSMGPHTRIDLQPLDRADSRILANELLKKLPEVPAALRELLTHAAEGNPFYMEELVKMLIDQGAIHTGESWRVDAGQLLVTRLPSTLTGVLQSRLDALPASQRRALQQASVVGAVFWDHALAAIDAQAVAQLPALAQRELALPRSDAQADGLREYAFKHQLLHQVTYDTVLRRYKREGHAKVAHWLAGLSQRGGLQSGDIFGLAAEHFERAGEDAQAAEFHGRAAEYAGQRLSHERVLMHVGRALSLLGEAGGTPDAHVELRWRLLTVREQTLHLQARREDQAVDLDLLESLAAALDDDGRRAEVAWRRGLRAMRMSDWTALERLARHGLDCATRAGDVERRLHALRLLGVAQVMLGDDASGRALLEQGLAQAAALKLRSVEARLLNALAVAASARGDSVGLLDLNRQSLLIYSEIGDLANEAIGRSNEGVGRLHFGDLTGARREFDAALVLLRAHGDRVIEGDVLCRLSTLTLWEGDSDGALALARSALGIAARSKAPILQALAAYCLGEAELAQGRTAAARQAFEQARDYSGEVEHEWICHVCAALARVALAEGDAGSALEALEPVLQHCADGGTLERAEAPHQIALTCHQALSCAGDPAASEWLDRAYYGLMKDASATRDAKLHEGLLNNIPHHLTILSLWAERESGSVKRL